MTRIERLNKIIEWSGLTPNAFSLRLGYKTGQSIYNYLDGKNDINDKIATKISNIFPIISKSWLLYDEGSMIKEDVLPKNSYDQDSPAMVIEEQKKDFYTLSPIDKLLNQNSEILRQNASLMETINRLVAIQDQQTKIIATNSETINNLSVSGSKNVPDAATGGR